MNEEDIEQVHKLCEFIRQYLRENKVPFLIGANALSSLLCWGAISVNLPKEIVIEEISRQFDEIVEFRKISNQ